MAELGLFRSLKIENFRGFREPAFFDLDASVVILVGPNGTGKTSFFDAIQWLLLGEVPRLLELRDRRKQEYVVNKWRASESATVSAELRIGNQRVFVKRHGAANQTQLEVHDENGVAEGAEAQFYLDSLLMNRTGVSLGESLTVSGLLEQDVLRNVIVADPKERYSHLTRLLGLEALPGFEYAASARADNRSKEAKELRSQLTKVEIELRAAQSEFDALLQDIKGSTTLERVYEEIRGTLAKEAVALQIAGDLPLEGAEIAKLAADARRVRERCDELLAEAQQLATGRIHDAELLEEQLAVASARLEEALSEVVVGERTVSQLSRQVATTQELTSLAVDLALRALPLLTDKCPVCGNRIDEQEVRVRLTRRISVENPELNELQGQQRAAIARQDELVQSREAFRRQVDELAESLTQSNLLTRRRSEWLANCKLLADGVGTLYPTNPSEVQSGNREELEQIRLSALTVERATRDLTAVLAAPMLNDRLERKRSQLDQLHESMMRLRRDVEAANTLANEERSLARATTEAVTNVTRQRFSALAPLMTEIYARLDPHPAFTKMDYDLDVYYGKSVAYPVVIDEEWELRADPLLVFSSSQANVAALSLFLAMNWTAGESGFPFLLLDDPLQAMDDINALGFADLCRHIRAERQLVLSTHDRRLGALLQRKLAPRFPAERTIVTRFNGWDRQGPQFEQEMVEPQIEAGERRVLLEAA